jgi:hypothetical protein
MGSGLEGEAVAVGEVGEREEGVNIAEGLKTGGLTGASETEGEAVSECDGGLDAGLGVCEFDGSNAADRGSKMLAMTASRLGLALALVFRRGSVGVGVIARGGSCGRTGTKGRALFVEGVELFDEKRTEGGGEGPAASADKTGGGGRRGGAGGGRWGGGGWEGRDGDEFAKASWILLLLLLLLLSPPNIVFEKFPKGIDGSRGARDTGVAGDETLKEG